MKTSILLEGIFPPIPTPFEHESVAYFHLTSNIKKWNSTGINGYVVFGSNGEYPYLSLNEKLKVIETVRKTAEPEKTIIAGSGCESTLETIQLTNLCADAGAHAALVITPHYYGGQMTENALLKHYIEVANQAKIPVILYNVTKFTNINLSAQLVAKLSKHENIIGIKDSSGNINQLGQYLNLVDPKFAVLVGTAGALKGALELGCKGGVLALANIAPTICVNIYKSVLNGDNQTAKDLQLQMIPVNDAVTAKYGVAGLKKALDLLGYYGGDPRSPLLPLTDDNSDKIEEILKQAKLL